jgi:hypothetical protein
MGIEGEPAAALDRAGITAFRDVTFRAAGPASERSLRRRKATRKETLMSENKSSGQTRPREGHAEVRPEHHQAGREEGGRARPVPRADKTTLLAESDNSDEEDDERLEGNQRRRLSLSTDRCENQGAE